MQLIHIEARVHSTRQGCVTFAGRAIVNRPKLAGAFAPLRVRLLHDAPSHDYKCKVFVLFEPKQSSRFAFFEINQNRRPIFTPRDATFHGPFSNTKVFRPKPISRSERLSCVPPWLKFPISCTHKLESQVDRAPKVTVYFGNCSFCSAHSFCSCCHFTTANKFCP